MVFFFKDEAGEPTHDPDAVVFIEVPCQCGKGYLWTVIGPMKSVALHIRAWDKNMATPTIDGSFDPENHECHFQIENGRYKND